MHHNPVIIDTQIEYYNFKMNNMEGPQQYASVEMTTYSGENIKKRIEDLNYNRYSIKSVTPIQQGVLDYMGDNMSAGGTSPTCGIVVTWERTCCSNRIFIDSWIRIDTNRDNQQNWVNWAGANSHCKNYSEAMRISKVALLKFPNDPLLLYNLSCYESLNSDFKSAQEHLNLAIKLDNKYEEMAKGDKDLFPLFIEGSIKF